MKSRFLWIGLLLLACTACSTPEPSTLTVKFKDKKYDQLLLALITDGNVGHKFEGESADGSNWSFSISDSLMDCHQYAYLYTELTDTTIAPLYFNMKSGTDTTRFMQPRLKKGDLFELQYLHSSYEEKSTFYHGRDVRMDEFVATGSMDFETYGRYTTSFFKSIFPTAMEHIRKHPASATLMYEVYWGRDKYSKEQLQEMYDAFEVSAQESYWGKKVLELLRMPLPDNPILRNLGSGQPEPMITDSSKYTLVTFSASWCGWCHKQIPLLKEVYADLHDKGLEMAYITADKEKDLEAWNKVMEEYSVSWRSLWAGKDTNLLTYKFEITGYPQAILFHPDGTRERLDVRKEEQKEKLYHLLNGRS